MKRSNLLITALLILNPFCYAGSGAEISRQSILSEPEAELIVAERMEARKAAEAARRSTIQAKESLAEWESVKRDGSGTKTIFRRVAPPPTPLKNPDSAPVRRQWTEEEIADFFRREAEGKPRLNISLSATVFDEEVTEIRLWHDGESYNALSNVPFSYLQVIGSFEDETAEWSFYGMVDRVDAEEEALFAERVKAFGGEYTTRSRPDKNLFSSMEGPEYLVLAERGQVVPEEVLIRLDAIHRYYLANEKILAIQYQRREALAEAQRKWREENPEEPKDTIINFWPIRSKSAAVEAERVSDARTPPATTASEGSAR